MSNSNPTAKEAGEAKKAEFPWIAVGVPIGCAIGIAVKNLALGIGIGMLLAAIIMVFYTKKEGRKISPVVRIALIVMCVAMVTLGFIARK